jgi:hypothetical protein
MGAAYFKVPVYMKWLKYKNICRNICLQLI